MKNAFTKRIENLKKTLCTGWHIDTLSNEEFYKLLAKVSNDVSPCCEHGQEMEYYSNTDKTSYPISKLEITHHTKILTKYMVSHEVCEMYKDEMFFQLVSFLAEKVAINITN
jgi:hypothetical protein